MRGAGLRISFPSIDSQRCKWMADEMNTQNPARTGFVALFAAATFALAAFSSGAFAAEQVDLELVIMTDVSGSIDNREAYLQRKGVADAFRSEEVIRAIRAGSLGRIGVAYVDFSSRFYNKIIVDWRIIHDEETAIGMAETLMSLPRTFGRGTSLSDAIELGIALLETNDLEGFQRTIDLSGDGPNNRGRPITELRDEAISKGITVNGLPIMDPYGFDVILDLDLYFSNCVVGGRSAFLQVAEGFDDFARAMRRKLVLEIAGLTPGMGPEQTPRVIPVQAAPERFPSPQLAPTQGQGPEEYEGGCWNRGPGGGFGGGFGFP